MIEQDYDSTDIWDEDDIYLVDNKDSSDSSILNREWERRHSQFHTMGFRDGITAGKEASAQEGFNHGFMQSASAGYSWGLVRGISRHGTRLV
ncbi:yae1 domain-containing protein 1-like [Phalaenopsis equestris]|uniref:yae1 domain-containing protein 1-like n=1 Tax=Phalaenopsis equestris TaxID=78828 RepID=UPI0009E39C35|nr:yae1 domain-containing protein 1-like [Phalaenopsis equestris]